LRGIVLHPNHRDAAPFEHTDTDNPALVLARRGITEERSAIEQVAGIPKIEAALGERPLTLVLIPLEFHRRMYQQLYI
jgi:hypothetical protein